MDFTASLLALLLFAIPLLYQTGLVDRFWQLGQGSSSGFDKFKERGPWHPRLHDKTAGSGLERQTLVISLDGFRWDYVERLRYLAGEHSSIWQLAKEGSFASKGVKSSFATFTLPNHYTLVTGLHIENHGIVSKSFYDPESNEAYNMKTVKNGSVFGGEPIWTTMKKQSKGSKPTVACMMWFGCQFGEFDPGYFVRNNRSIPWSERIDKVMDWLSEESMKLVLMYYPEPDGYAHTYGPDADHTDEMLVVIDSMIGDLVGKLKEKGMFEKLNLMIVSDHGMAKTEFGLLLPPLPKGLVHVRSKEPTMWLVDPLPGRLEEAEAYFKKFQHVEVYRKEEIPERWHYKHNPRITPLVIMAEVGYKLSGGYKGNHGYDNELQDMRPTIIGHGSAFTPKSTVPESMGTVDVYLLLCTILDLAPAPNNGSASHFESFLRTSFRIQKWQ